MKRKRISVFDILVRIFLLAAVFVTLYPFIYVLSMSISGKEYVVSKSVWLFPKGFSLDSYKMALQNPDVLQGYYNSFWYTIVGTLLSVAVTTLGAYALSRKDFICRRFFMLLIVFPMFFSSGIIPTYILMQKLHLYDTRWAIVLSVLVNGFYFIICRTFFEAIPEAIIESAKIDGYNDFQIFCKIVVPISKPVFAIMGLYYAVDKWSNYFWPMLLLRNETLKPIQIYLMKVLTQFQDNALMSGVDNMVERAALSVQMRYALIVLTVLPIAIIYPFLQKYFIQGVMIGAIKE